MQLSGAFEIPIWINHSITEQWFNQRHRKLGKAHVLSFLIRILPIYIWFETCFVHFQPLGFHLMNLKWTKALLKKKKQCHYHSGILFCAIELNRISLLPVTYCTLFHCAYCTCMVYSLQHCVKWTCDFFFSVSPAIFSVGRHEVFNPVHGSM